MSKKQSSSFWVKAIITEVVAAGGILAVIGAGGKSGSSIAPPPLAPPTISIAQRSLSLPDETPSAAAYAWAEPAAFFPEPAAAIEPPPLLSSWRTSSGLRRSGPPLIDPSRR